MGFFKTSFIVENGEIIDKALNARTDVLDENLS